MHLHGLVLLSAGWNAEVARYLCRALRGTRWEPMLFAGSIGTATDTSNAERFFTGIRCEALDYTPARSQWSLGADCMTAAVPMSASYEDKGDVADRIFLDLDDAAFDRQVDSWTRFLMDRATTRPSVVHLHHLTPMHEAVRIVWPGVPVVTHLHGTELKMLASVHDNTALDGRWPWERQWVERMRGWAAASERVIVVGDHDEQMVRQVLPVDPCRITMIANGVDTDVFAPRVVHPANVRTLETLARRRTSRLEPGWVSRIDPLQPRRSLGVRRRRRPAGACCAFVGRFMRFKRLQLLIEAHHTMRSLRRAAPCW